MPVRRPDLAIVLVDSDGENQRRSELNGHVEGLPVTRVIGVAHQAFEAWLAADYTTVGEVLEGTVDAPPAVEMIPAREVKELVRGWIHELAPDADEKSARIEIARRCDLSILARNCHSFEVFCKELAQV